MVSVNRSLATSVFAGLALLHSSAATAHQYVPEDEPASTSMIHANISEVILLSVEGPWKEAHSTFARLLGIPVTTWSKRNHKFTSYVMEVFFRGKKPVFFTVDPSLLRDAPSMLNIRGVVWVICSDFFAFQKGHGTTSCSKGLKTPPPRCKVIQYLKINETIIQSISWTPEYWTDVNRSSKHALRKVRPFEPSCVVGQDSREITVPCLVQRYDSRTIENCGRFRSMRIIELLKQKNITVRQGENISDSFIRKGLATNIFSMTHKPVYLFPRDIISFDLPYIRVVFDAFYSRVDAHRIISLHEVVGECWKLVATTFALLALVVYVSVVIGRFDESVWRGTYDTALFLLAAVLATSATLPTAFGRVGAIRKALLGLWIAALLPLSAYFRTELTAMLTVRRPADRIDTLQKLEDALDRRQVLPCFTKPFIDVFPRLAQRDPLMRRPLMTKLWISYWKHMSENIVTDNISSCVECASRGDRVCYATLGDSPSLRRRGVRPIAEHLNTWLEGFLMYKYHPLLRPLRKFFRDIDEHKLIVWDARESENEIEESEFDISGLLLLLAILHATSCLVLVLEVVVARFHRQAVTVPGLLWDTLSRISKRRSAESI